MLCGISPGDAKNKLQGWSRWGPSSEPHGHGCPVTKGRESHCWAQTHTLSPFRPFGNTSRGTWWQTLLTLERTSTQSHTERASHPRCTASSPGWPWLGDLASESASLFAHKSWTLHSCRIVVNIWVPGMDTCSRIITVVPIVSLIKGRRDSEHRDWNTSLKSRALAWPWRVWVNTPTGMAGLI